MFLQLKCVERSRIALNYYDLSWLNCITYQNCDRIKSNTMIKLITVIGLYRVSVCSSHRLDNNNNEHNMYISWKNAAIIWIKIFGDLISDKLSRQKNFFLRLLSSSSKNNNNLLKCQLNAHDCFCCLLVILVVLALWYPCNEYIQYAKMLAD